MILLDATQIKAHLTAMQFKGSYALHCLKSIDSTNQFLMELPANQQHTICCAEEQTAGRGRFGRLWNSPLGENIYCSFRRSGPSDHNKLAGLSLVVGLAIIQSLQTYLGQEKLALKWPNDVLWNHKKLCGILIELNGNYTKTQEIILGIGLNVNSAAGDHPLSDKPWCSLLDITGRSWDRNHLIAELINTVTQYLDRFFESGFAAFLTEWQRFDALKGLWITVAQTTSSLSGYARGVNEQGYLCLEDEQGVLHEIGAGEATLLR